MERDILIREIVPDDACNLLKFAKAILQEEIYSFTSINEFNFGIDEEKEWIKNMLKNKNNVFLVVEHKNELIGNISIIQNTSLKSSHVSELSINIMYEYRNKGIGTILMDAGLKKINGCPDIKKIVLQVFDNNERAIALYKKYGFTEEGKLKRQIKFNKESYVDVCLMAKWI